MNGDWIGYALAAVMFIYLIALLVVRVNHENEINPPRVVIFNHLSAYTTQEVYDWVVYVAKLDGRSYLEGLTWDNAPQHAYLLSSLKKGSQSRSHKEMLNWFKIVGEAHHLVTDIVNKP